MDGSNSKYPECMSLEAGADVSSEIYGARAHAITGLVEAKLPIPPAWVFSSEAVKRFQFSDFPDQTPVAKILNEGRLVSVRASPVERSWGGPSSLLNIGMTGNLHKEIADHQGQKVADYLYFKFVSDFATRVNRLDGEDFEEIVDRARTDGKIDYSKALNQALTHYESETDEAFPQDPMTQLQKVLRSMSMAWGGASARILREARGAPSDAGLGLIVQEMALGLGQGESGSGIAQFIMPSTGKKQAFGRYLSQSQGRDALDDEFTAKYLAKDPRGQSLEDVEPKVFANLKTLAQKAKKLSKDEMKLEFTIVNGELWILDAVSADRMGRGAVSILVGLVDEGIITKEKALMRLDPLLLTEVLHPQIDPKAEKNVMTQAIGASPGAATGRIVFNATSAVASEARGEAAILLRTETSPDDIRGMHSSNGILTERGGINSHAAVVARTLGLPCVVGAQDIGIDSKQKILRLPDGSELAEGAVITLDGTTGEVLWGSPKLVEPKLEGDFQTFMSWADEFREIDIRGNADTPQDVRMAQSFGVDGIGLVRTEHMFFDTDRLTVMRELIFAESKEDRDIALNLLLPMQRGDFVQIFSLMKGRPVCIRLLDPPLHEFLPTNKNQAKALAEAMDISLSHVNSRMDELSEFNPMLGTRGVRLGVTIPEIYEMQARAIFEAACEVSSGNSLDVHPEIMIPLVSATREVELVKSRLDAVASAVQSERGITLDFSVGVMVETPRAALRAGEISRTSEFLSFGTNDLTQMTYGLSRDDAGRFMREYVNNKIFVEDPFYKLDFDGVGELLTIAAERARKVRPNQLIGLCGEHGGDPDSVKFCCERGFDYISCSPFRTPIAKLAAAQAKIGK